MGVFFFVSVIGMAPCSEFRFHLVFSFVRAGLLLCFAVLVGLVVVKRLTWR